MIFHFCKFLSPKTQLYSQFTRIASIEQRRRYKTEFDHDYAEYMRLHANAERITKKFVGLEERLRKEMDDQRYKVNIYWMFCHPIFCVFKIQKSHLQLINDDFFLFDIQEIQRQIVTEYMQTMDNSRHQEDKKR